MVRGGQRRRRLELRDVLPSVQDVRRQVERNLRERFYGPPRRPSSSDRSEQPHAARHGAGESIQW